MPVRLVRSFRNHIIGIFGLHVECMSLKSNRNRSVFRGSIISYNALDVLYIDTIWKISDVSIKYSYAHYGIAGWHMHLNVKKQHTERDADLQLQEQLSVV